MFVETTKRIKKNGSTYRQDLLRETFRDENGKVQHRTLANFTGRPIIEIDAIKMALKSKGKLPLTAAQVIGIQQGNSVGATLALLHMANVTHIKEALGKDEQAKLALWQIFSRVLQQGSRLSSVRIADSNSACDLLDLEQFNEDDLYKNLEWLATNQNLIEERLFKLRHPDLSQISLFLYDVTSSYLEGEKNDLAEYGYNRDKKKGKKQIVIGLLCDSDGYPVSVQVFRGNTGDTTTFYDQIKKVSERFKVKKITFVGDRGMIKSSQIEKLNQADFFFITALTKPQIETLIEDKSIDISLFDNELFELSDRDECVSKDEDSILRYVLRRNPIRQKEIEASRTSKLNSLLDFAQKQNKYLLEHSKAKENIAYKKVIAKAKKLNIDSWVTIDLTQRIVTVKKDECLLKEKSKFDGCYVIKTNIPKSQANKDIVHDRYKDLSLIESAFRTMKTRHLEVRPVHVRLESRTRAHVFIVMLSYIISKELFQKWSHLDVTVQEGLFELSSLCSQTVTVGEHVTHGTIPEPRTSVNKLLQAAGVSLPKCIKSKGIRVATRKKLSNS